ncbi:predicted protein [Plenodomus lingam JN3]|uniref:Predicted protein n=1 Tax=Leptosphaeria maculans (strain JN3 / isolate v23.1.3 / race Av1-4-5-6-7-8) TaxID=985895 RepID=E4ZRB1_LEPMJ|nr:predicted protein [Plenodomus lingam JN3]CBX93776.1 predicted protein [Plenodomus lingam JN3]
MYTPLLSPPTLDDRQESCHARNLKAYLIIFDETWDTDRMWL